MIENLENIRRERDVQEEFNRLKERVQGLEALLEQEKKNELLKKSAEIIRRKQSKQLGFKTKDKPKAKVNKAIKKAVNAIEHTQSAPILNEQQVLGLGIMDEKMKIEKNLLEIAKGNDKADKEVLKRKKKVVKTLAGSKKPNAYMQNFREKHKGQFSASEMMKRGAEAYREINNTGGSSTTVEKRKKKINKLEDEYSSNDEPMYDFTSDIATGKEQQHLSHDLTPDKRIKKTTESHSETKGMVNLANAYRKYIDSQKYN